MIICWCGLYIAMRVLNINADYFSLYSSLAMTAAPVLSCPGSLRSGDIRTHTFHGYQSAVIDTSFTPFTLHHSIPLSRKVGIYHDVGHGQGAFSWTVAEICAREGFWPDTISTDLHRGNINGPAYDLPTVMSRFLSLGMPLYEVIKAATLTPAKAINKHHLIGSLSPGRCADVTVLQLKDCDVMFEDCQQQMRKVTRRLVPIAVWRSGERVSIKDQWAEWPNASPEYLTKLNQEWKDQLIVKDDC